MSGMSAFYPYHPDRPRNMVNTNKLFDSFLAELEEPIPKKFVPRRKVRRSKAPKADVQAIQLEVQPESQITLHSDVIHTEIQDKPQTKSDSQDPLHSQPQRPQQPQLQPHQPQLQQLQQFQPPQALSLDGQGLVQQDSAKQWQTQSWVERHRSYLNFAQAFVCIIVSVLLVWSVIPGGNGVNTSPLEQPHFVPSSYLTFVRTSSPLIISSSPFAFIFPRLPGRQASIGRVFFRVFVR